MVTPVEESILATVAYAHIFNYPLTIVELQRWLLRFPFGAEDVYGSNTVGVMEASDGVNAPALYELEKMLVESEWLRERITYNGGFIYLRGHEAEDAEARATGYCLTQQKLRRARRAAWLFSLFPFVRGIGVANRVSWGCARETSDIDLFVVGAAGRLWLVRLLVTGCAALFGWRPRDGEGANTLCLSFYIAENGLDLGGVRFQKNDLHFALWLYQVLPLYDESGVFDRLVKENAHWLDNFFLSGVQQGGVARVVTARGVWFKKIIEWFFRGACGAFVERWVHRVQQKKLDARRAKEKLPYESAVAYTDSLIKLHWNDRRLLYYNEWVKAYAEAHNKKNSHVEKN